MLVDDRHRICERFADEARRRHVPPGPTPVSVIVDHLDLFLDDIIAALSRASAADPEGTGRAHGAVRWRTGYDIASIVEEYRLLHDLILDQARERGVVPTADELAVLSDAIHRGVGAACAEYSRFRDDEHLAQRREVEVERTRLQTILKILPIGLIVADAEARFLEANGAMEVLWGGPVKLGEPDGCQQFRAWWSRTGKPVEPDEWPLIRSLTTGELVSNEEMDILAFDSIPKAILISAAPIESEAGKRIGGVLLAIDVTAQRRAVQMAEAAVRARDEILAVVSHDLKNPLQTTKVSASLLKKLVAAPAALDPARVVAKADAILRATDRMEALIRDLLDLARIREGALPLDLHEESAAEILKYACEQGSPIAEEQGLALVVDGAGDHHVRADRGRLLQVFANLISNAVRFTPKGGRITLAATRLDRMCHFIVRDTGTGIHEKQLPHVFDRFWQGEAAPRHGTVGLGLSIVRGIVEAHGGRVWADSRIGQGTTFTFAIPIA